MKQLSFFGDSKFLSRQVVILISGKAGVGKTTSAGIINGILSDMDYKSKIKSFASGVKKVAKEHFYWDGNKDSAGRKLLQGVGKIGRDYYEDIWVTKALNEFDVFDDIYIIDDWRFPNEYRFIEKEDFSTIKIRVEAPNREILKGTDEYNDVSEISLPSGYYRLNLGDSIIERQDTLYDYVIDNTGSMESLMETLNGIVKDIFEKGVIE